jgi:hypothetical protein
MKNYTGLALAWVCLCCLTLAAFALWVEPAFSRERTILAAAHDAYVRANENDERTRDAGRLSDIRRRLTAEITGMRGPTLGYRGEAGVLRTLADLERRDNVAVARFDDDTDQHQSLSKRTLTVEITGAYRDVIGAVAALSRGPALLHVGDISVERPPNSVASSVVAVVHVISYDRVDDLP